MTRALRFRFWAFAAALPFLAMSIGCDTSQARYKPTSSEARSSLEAALTAWRDGKPYGSVPADAANSSWRYCLAIWPAGRVVRDRRRGRQRRWNQAVRGKA